MLRLKFQRAWHHWREPSARATTSSNCDSKDGDVPRNLATASRAHCTYSSFRSAVQSRRGTVGDSKDVTDLIG